MKVSTARWLLFLFIALTLPLPLLGYLHAFAPAIRYLVLAVVTAAVALVEGASGPVPLILLLFAAHALVYLALEWLVAWGLARGLARFSPKLRGGLVAAACFLLLFFSVAFDLYQTPFGTLPRSNLMDMLS